MPKAPPLSLLARPYHHLRALDRPTVAEELRAQRRKPGCALVWNATPAPPDWELTAVMRRPGGMSLLVILPSPSRVIKSPPLLHLLHQVRPHGILPCGTDHSLGSLTQILRRPPDDLAAELTEYLSWRGITLDLDTRRIVRRIVELSADLRSISAISRSLYLSRRALGRRFLKQGLPVPSHWLQVSRLLRIASKLQNSVATLSSVAYDSGYPDGFSISNQMQRLFGHRPSDVRKSFGWEWIAEAWLQREAGAGSLALGMPVQRVTNRRG